jgi:Carboxypeptidase regulatory-like domain/TonB dependent receptor-like, beta-barrel
MKSFKSWINAEVWARARKAMFVLGAAVGSLLLCLPLFSQGNYGRILGRVTDQTGGVIPGAPVAIINTGTGVTRNLTTDEAGEYSAPNLIPGQYTVRVSATGFARLDRTGIQLETGKDIRVDVQLKAGEVTQTIEVTGMAPMVDTTNVTLGGTLSNETINDLPLNGRNYINLLSLRPGVEQYPGGGAWTQAANGLRVEDVNWVIDGLDNNESFQGEPIINSPGIAGDSATILPIDAIQEFNVLENPKAEFGWKAGAVVNIGLKSGTNNIHGSAYAFGRSDAFDARNYFNHVETGCGPPCPKPGLNFEQWGGTAGGPIVKNKLFYFGGFEEQRYAVGNNYLLTVPSSAPGAGPSVSIPDAAAQLNQYCLSPAGVAAAPPFCSGPGGAFVQNDLSTALLTNGVFTPPNSSINPANGSVFTAFDATNKSDNVLAKIDYTISANHTVGGSYFLGNDNNIAEDAKVTRPEFLDTFKIRSQYASGHWIWTPNSHLVNEARFGFVRYTRPVNPVDTNVAPTTYGINTGVTDPLRFGMPTIFVGGLAEVGAWFVWPTNVGPNNNFDFVDQVSYLRGKHTFKFGGEIRYARMTQLGCSHCRGQFDFTQGSESFPGSTPLEDFLSGSPDDGLVSVGNPVRHYRYWEYAAFVQDDWRIRPRVTLNLGLRWEYQTPLSERDNLIANFIPGSKYGMVQVGTNGLSSPYNRDKTNFAPRLGVAWDISGNGTTVIRAGGGIFYEALQASVFTGQGVALQNDPGGGGIGNEPTAAPLITCPAACLADTQAKTVDNVPGGMVDTGTKFYPGFLLNWSAAGPVLPLVGARGQVQCGDGVTPPFDPMFGQFGAPDPFPCSIVAVAQNFRTPYIGTWTLTLQHAFSPSLSLEVAYVGNHGSRLSGLVDINQINPQSAAELACGHCEDNADRPYASQYPYLRFINMVGNPYRSNYHGLQVTFTGRNFHGLSFVAGYTYAHALDDLTYSAFNSTPQDNTNIAAQYGNSDFDIRHRLTLTTTYNIPGKSGWGQILQGWAINSIVTLSGSQPYAAFDTFDDISRTGELMDRWDLISMSNPSTPGNPADFQSTNHTIPFCGAANGLVGADFSNPATIQCTEFVPSGPLILTSQTPAFATACYKAAQAINAATVDSLNTYGCYVQGGSVMIPPAIGTFGTMGRNVLRDSGYRNWDLSVFKDFKFKERLTAQFRAEFFNVLNHPSFANPLSSINLTGIGNNADPGSRAPTASGFGCGCLTPDQAATDPVLGSGGPRAIQLGLKFIF